MGQLNVISRLYAFELPELAGARFILEPKNR